MNPLTLPLAGGSPAADLAGLSRQCAVAGQRNGLHILVEVRGTGQTDQGKAVEGRAVGAVRHDKVDADVLLCALFHGNIMVPQRCNSRTIRSARTRRRKVFLICGRSFRRQEKTEEQ